MYTYNPHNFETDDVLDVRRLNDVFFTLTHTIGGGLSEVVWDENFISAAGFMDPGVFGRVWYVGSETDMEAGLLASTTGYTKTWQPAPSMSMEVDSRGGLFVIEASCQLRNEVLSASIGSVAGCIQVAIRVDGSVQGGSVIGTGDFGNDALTEKHGVRYELDVNGLPVPKYYGGTGPALRGVRTPVATGCMLRLAPGKHTVEVVYRNPYFGTAPVQHLGNGGLYAIELPA